MRERHHNPTNTIQKCSRQASDATQQCALARQTGYLGVIGGGGNELATQAESTAQKKKLNCSPCKFELYNCVASLPHRYIVAGQNVVVVLRKSTIQAHGHWTLDLPGQVRCTLGCLLSLSGNFKGILGTLE